MNVKPTYAHTVADGIATHNEDRMGDVEGWNYLKPGSRLRMHAVHPNRVPLCVTWH